MNESEPPFHLQQAVRWRNQLEVKSRATSFLLLAILVSCREHSVLERNTVENADSYVYWFTTQDGPDTCFINVMATEPVTEQSFGDQAASFRYDTWKFRSEKSNLVITTVGGTHTETVRTDEFIYLLAKGRYTKIRQTEKIRNLMKHDYNVMGGELIGHLRAEGKL